MTRLSTVVGSLLFGLIGAHAQYCSPSFANGCSGWYMMSMNMGSSFNWNYTECTSWDQTATTIIVNPVDSIPMSVTNGAWCGCSVWVDFNNSGSFEDAENLYHIYVGGTPSYTYNFNIGIPPGTPEGLYRMRVVGAWGSDGFTSGSQNGFGACGSFQYGNFNDFTLMVDNTTTVADLNTSMPAFTASPNPTLGTVTLTSRSPVAIDDVITVESMDGRAVRQLNGTGTRKINLELGSLPAGVYLVRSNAGANALPLRLVKE